MWHTGDFYAVEKEFEDDRDSGYGSGSSEAYDAGHSLHLPAAVADNHQQDSLETRESHLAVL